MANRVITAFMEGEPGGILKAFGETAAGAKASAKTVVSANQEMAAASEESSAASSGGLGGVMSKLSNFGGVWTKVAAVGVAAAIGIGVASIDMANKYDDSTAKMAATSGLTIEQANKIGDAFLTTGGQTVFSAQQMMNAYGPVSAQLGMVNGGALSAQQSLTVMNASAALASATGGDLNSTASALSATLFAFHQPISQAAADTDILFNASRVTNMSVGDFEAGIAKLHGRMGDLGGSLPQLSTMFVDLANHGVTGKTAITAMTSATNTLLGSTDKNSAALDKARGVWQKADDQLNKLKDSHTATASAIAVAQAKVDSAAGSIQTLTKGAGAMGLTVYNAQGQFVGMQSIISQLQPKLKGMTDEQRRTAENAIFGAGAYDKLDSTIMAGNAGWSAASAAVTKHGTAQTAANTATATLSGSMDKIKGAISNVGVTIGQKLMPFLSQLMNGLSIATVWFAQKLPGAMDVLGQVFSRVFAVLGVVFQVWLKAWQIGFGIIGGVIGVFIGVFNAVEPVVAGVVSVIATVIGGIATAVSAVASVIIPVFRTAFGIIAGIIGGVVGVVTAITGTVEGIFRGLGQAIGNIWNGIVDGVKAVFSGLGRVLKDIINAPVNAINGVIDFINKNIQIHIPAVGVGPVHTPSFDWNGLNIGHIGTLDTGGVTNRPTLSMLSMNSIPEVTTPVPLLRAELARAMGGGGNGHGGVTIEQLIVQGGDPNAIVRALKQYQRQNGSIPVKTTGH